MTAYSRDVDETKYMYVLTKDDELLQKYNSIKKNLTVNRYTMKTI